MSRLPLIATVLAILAIAVGIFSGLQVVKAERSSKIQTIDEYMKEHNLTPKTEIVDANLPKPEVIGDLEHNFGHIGYQEVIRIEFKIKNVGGSELRIDQGEVSCGKCTVIEVPKDNLPEGVKPAPESTGRSLLIAPGATASVFVAFTQKNKEYVPQVSEWARFHTSDPRQKEIEFRIAGKITKTYRLKANQFSLGSLTIGHGLESRLGVFGYGVEPLRIDRVEFLSEVKESEFTAKIEPMPTEEVQAEEGATSGFNIVLTALNPPLGKISQALRLHVANADPPTVDIPVEGTVVGNIQIIRAGASSANWSPSLNYLDWSTVDGKTGAEVNLMIRARMKQSDPLIEFRIKEIFPSDLLEAEFGESKRTENAQTVPLTIRIPPGSKPANYRSLSVDSKPARIVIETNDPVTKEIVIGVRFGIE